jgi:hypothetical protein
VTWSDDYGDESMFCDCGVTLSGAPDESDGLCSVCAGAPHGRDCRCGECEDYWKRIEAESIAAAEAFNRQLVCTCGWTGAYIEHHDRTRQPDCRVSKRHA